MFYLSCVSSYLKLFKKLDFNLAEGDVLLGPELVVPVLGLLPQVSQPFLQLRLALGDAVNDRPQVGQRVWWTDPVVCGAGCRSEGRSLQVNRNQRNEECFSARLLLRITVRFSQHKQQMKVMFLK